MNVDRPVVVWGAGAMGGTIGAHLVRTGVDVIFVDADADHVAAMRNRGLRITGPITEFSVETHAATSDEITGPLFLVLLCVKAHHTDNAIRQIAPLLAADGVVVSVQNGLNERRIAAEIGEARTFGCFVNFGADYLEPGVIHYGGRGTLALGELDGGTTTRARAIHALFRRFDDGAILTDNVNGYLWSKMAYASLLFATAASPEGIADALARTEHRDVYTSLAREVVSVASAAGVRLEPFDGFDPAAFDAHAPAGAADRSVDHLVEHNRRSAKTHSGIWRDLFVRHRPTEVDAQLGAVVAVAKRLGVPVPHNERLVAMIHELEDTRRSAAIDNIAELRDSPDLNRR